MIGKCDCNCCESCELNLVVGADGVMTAQMAHESALRAELASRALIDVHQPGSSEFWHACADHEDAKAKTLRAERALRAAIASELGIQLS